MNGILLLDKPAGCRPTPPCSGSERLWAPTRPATSAASIPWPPACCRSAWARPPRSPATSLLARKRYQFTCPGCRTATGDAEGRGGGAAHRCRRCRPRCELALAAFRGSQSAGAAHVLGAEARGPAAVQAGARRCHGASARRAASRSASCRCCDWPPAQLELTALCSKGTYIRVLAEDIARPLGTCGHVSALRRLVRRAFRAAPDA